MTERGFERLAMLMVDWLSSRVVIGLCVMSYLFSLVLTDLGPFQKGSTGQKFGGSFSRRSGWFAALGGQES
jgi:hypothetical protein